MIGIVVLSVSLAASGARPSQAIPIIVFGVALLGLLKIVIRRSPITGSETAYASYINNLRAAGNYTRRPWISFLLQTLLFGIPLGVVAYLGARSFT